MDLFKLDIFLDAISKYLKLNQPFRIIREKKGLTWEPAFDVKINHDLESIQIFSDYIVENVGILDFRGLPEEYFYKIRALVVLLERFIKDRKRKHGDFGREVFLASEQKILSLRLGGKINYREIPYIDLDLYSFIKVNKLDHKFFALGIQLKPNLALPFEIEANVYKDILWEEIERKNLIDSTGRIYGFRFFYHEKLLAETDTKFLLTEEFSILYRGITFYHPQKALHIAPLDKRSESLEQKGYSIEVITLHKKGSLILLLRKADGFVYCIGIEKRKISSPSDGVFGPYKCKYQMKVTKDEFDAIFGFFEKDKYYKRNMNEKELLIVIQKNLKLDFLPEKMLTSKCRFLSYVFLPFGIIKYFFSKKKYPCYNWKDVLLRPYSVSSMNGKKITKWLETSANLRSGKERCFE